MSLYQELRDIGWPLDSHESDLYVLDRPEARNVVERSGLDFSSFRSDLDGKWWIEIPFAYDPWWRNRVDGHG